jgi:hypothetical protein
MVSQKIIKLYRKHQKITDTIIFGGIVFILHLFVFYGANRYYSGDAAVMGLITRDYQHFKFYSWYFYGQNYFGNLENIIFAILTIPTGVSMKVLAFWEQLFYFFSIVLALQTFKKITKLQIIVTFLTLFTSIKYLDYIWTPQGFSFVLLILSSIYFYFNWFQNLNQKIFNNRHTIVLLFVAGFMSSLSLWHNPQYIFTLPVGIITAILKYKNLKISVSKKQLITFILSGISGLITGIIPFFLATVSQNGDNIKYFSNNNLMASSALERFNYYLYGLFYQFQSVDFAAPFTLRDISDKIQFQMSDFLGMLGMMIFIVLFLIGVLSWRKYKINLLFILPLFALLIIKNDNVSQISLSLLARYSMPFVFFFIITGFQVSFENLSNNVKLSDFTKGLTTILMFILTIISIKNLIINNSNPHKNREIYELVYSDIKSKHNTDFIYCEGFWEVCGQVALLGATNNNLTVQLFDTSNITTSQRNPGGIGKTDEASQSNQKILSLITDISLKPEHKILERYVFRGKTSYYLIQGSYK